MTKVQIPFNRALFSAYELQLVLECVQRGHVSGSGPFTKQAETDLETRVKLARALLTTSCTHALEMSALLLDLKPGDEVIVPSYTFVSTASAFALFGATPVFVDSDSRTLNVNPELVEAAVTPRTRAICVVHYGGIACDMEILAVIAGKHNLILIEDNAHGLLAKYNGRYLGTFGALATQSFHETKNITCGEGGALIVNDASLVERAEILREKGTDRSKFLRGQVDKYTWVDIGSSWVMSDLLAAILYGQLQRADTINAQRVAIWNRYHADLATWADKHDVTRPHIPEGCEHVGHVYHLRFRQGEMRTRFIDHMKQRGVSCVFHYQPLHVSPVGRRFGGFPGQCPVSEHAGECLVRLPLFNSLSDADQSRVIDAATSFIP
jgi:dTDP-4-amino-4,6-dideoxygalactose transaminase